MESTTHSKLAEDNTIQGIVEKAIFMAKKESNIPAPLEPTKKRGKIEYYQWGSNNLYPQWLNYLKENNAIHSGIIRSKVHYTVAGGLIYTGDETDLEDQANFLSFFNNGKSDYDLNEISEQVSQDFEISNKFILRGLWSRDFSRCESLELIDFEEARALVDGSGLVVSQDWTDNKVGLKIYEPLDLKLKGSKPQAGTKRNREFYVEYSEKSKQTKIKDRSAINKGVYPNPPYSGGIKSICTGIEIDEYQNSEIVNGFALGTIVNLNNGVPKNDTEKKKVETGIKDASTGATNAGGVWISYNNGKDRAATVENLKGNDLNKRYIEVNKDTQKNILRAHSVTTPILFGFMEEGSLGNATELKIGYAIMMSNYFKNRQRAIAYVFTYIGQRCNGLKGELGFAENPLNLPDEKDDKPGVIIDQRKFNEEPSKESKLLTALSRVGSPSNRKNVLKKFEFSQDRAGLSEKEIIESFIKDTFVELNTDEATVLKLRSEGNGFDAIREALGIKNRELAEIYQSLIAKELIDSVGTLTKAGALEIARSDASKMKIVYSYELREDAPDLVPGGESREFCVTLIELDRFYSREEIDLIGAIEGYDVFAYKGGWYHNPETGVNSPFCRHSWFQNVVFEN